MNCCICKGNKMIGCFCKFNHLGQLLRRLSDEDSGFKISWVCDDCQKDSIIN